MGTVDPGKSLEYSASGFWTSRSRVRAAQKFLGWLATAHCVAFPKHWKQLIEYLQVSLSEPCVRGALKATDRSSLFLQEAAGVSEKLTDSALYDVSKKELLAAALPGNPHRQALRFPTILLAAFEDNVISTDVPVFWRAMSMWLLLQSWATLRFDDHRGITPTEVSVSSSGLNGRLTRTKVSGPDRGTTFGYWWYTHRHMYIKKTGWLLGGVFLKRKRRTCVTIFYLHRRTISADLSGKNFLTRLRLQSNPK